MNLSIKHWPEQERPRERLIRQGAASLSDAELFLYAQAQNNILQLSLPAYCYSTLAA